MSRYAAWHGGPDPLAPPYDIREALDRVGDDVLAGASPRQALNRLLHGGADGRDGLDALRRRARERARELRNAGRLDGTLDQVRELLDQALDAERRALFPDPGDAARMAEAELDALPGDTSRAVRALADYRWRSDEARQAYQQIQNLLREQVLDAQFAGMRDALKNATPQDMTRIREMMRALNDMIDADARGEHTQQDFDAFMSQYAEFFPDDPHTLDELIDSLARRAAAAQRLLDSLSPEQRAELESLMAQAMTGAGLAEEMSRLQQGLRSARPDLRWGGRQRMGGEQPLGFADATGALAELADLDELEHLLSQDYPGASLEDVDEELIQRALGQRAVDDIAALRRIENELRRQGYLRRNGDGLSLTPRALRRLGSTALKRVFDVLESRGRGSHDVRDAGAAGEVTGASREWRFGDEQPIDVVRTVGNAVRRSLEARVTAPPFGPGTRGGDARVGAIGLAGDDFEVVETERRSCAAVALLVDMSYSMELRGTWGEAKTTALALHALVSTRYPQDAIEIIGFSDYARVMSTGDLVDHDWDRVQGTNLQHGLMLARRFLDKHHNAEPVILVITDGEPTAHIARDGFADFAWPPTVETITATLAEVERCTRRGASINVFMLDDDPRLVSFMHEIGRRNGGRVFLTKPGALGEYVVSDYLRARRGRRRTSRAS